MSDASGAEGSPPLTRTRQFWVLLGYAAALGVVGALASLVFMGVIGFGDNWYVVPVLAGSAGDGGGSRSPQRPVSWSGCFVGRPGCRSTPLV